LQKKVQICVVGKNSGQIKSKVLALNKTLSKYFLSVKPPLTLETQPLKAAAHKPREIYISS
jgi:hypothetical protein